MAEDSGEFSGLIDGDAVDLIIAYQAIRDPDLKKSILSMVKKQARIFLESPKKGR